MIRILHVIDSLATGGTELFLARLVESFDVEEFEHRVVALFGSGPAGERMRRRGIRVEALQVRGRLGGVPGLLRLRRLLREVRPDLVQGWLYHGNLAAALAMRFGSVRFPLLWNVRHSLDQWADEKSRLRAEIRFSGWLAGAPQRVVFNSARSARQHEQWGYPRAKACVIPNGFDAGKFSPNAASRMSTRAQLAIGSDALVLGTIGRYHPLKDHANFLRAARGVADAQPDARFVLAGRQLTPENRTLMSLIQELQLQERVMLLGERADVPELLNAMDIYVSSSSSEAFPNAVGEAMCCGIPCVVTDTGDSAELVADAGLVVPVKSPRRLAEGALQLIRSGAARRKQMGVAARERIRLNYSNTKIAQQYADLYSSVCART